MMGFPQRGEGNLTRATSLCKNFQPNMFNKTKCQNCFRTREAHDLDGGDGSNKPKKVLLCGYLFIAPGLDPDNPVSRSRKWQRRCFILYEHGELAYALDDSINTVPQGVINMYQCSTVFNADVQTGQKFSLGIQTTTSTTFIRAETREEKDSWLETLSEYPQINKENERLKQRQLKLAAQHAAREEKYAKLNADAGIISTPNLNQAWPKTGTDKEDILKELNQPKVTNSSDGLKRSQSSVETRPKYLESNSYAAYSRSTSVQPGQGIDPHGYSSQAAKRKNDIPSSLASKSIRSEDETRSVHQGTIDGLSDRASRMRSRIRASDTGISELSKSSAALALGIQRSRSDIMVDRSSYTPLHQNNNNVNSDLVGLGSRGDSQRRSWRLRGTQDPPLPATQELPSPLEKSPRDGLFPSSEGVVEDSGVLGRDRTDTNESQTSTVSTGSRSSDDQEKQSPKVSGLRMNKAMLDGDSPSPSKRTIERRKNATNRRGRHTVTVDSSMHVIPSSDESDPNKETPTLKRSNSDPNLADSDDMLKRKQIAMTFPGLFHLKKGWLVKQGDGEQDWTKHWFVLCNNKLSYYKDSRDEDPNSLDGVIDLAKCNQASETPVSRNYGFQIELDTGLIILAAMTSGIRNNWVGAINKAIKTAREDSTDGGKPTPTVADNKPLFTRTKPNSLPISKSTSDVRSKEERSSPTTPVRKSIHNADLMPSSSKNLTETETKTNQSPVDSKTPLERRPSGQSQVPKTSPLEALPTTHPAKSEARSNSVSKSTSPKTRHRKSSATKEGASTEARRNSVTKEQASKDGSSSDSKSGKTKERRGRKGSRSERRSQEESAAAVTAALAERSANQDSKPSTAVRKSRSNSQPQEPTVLSPESEQHVSSRLRADSDSRKQLPAVDNTVMALLEQEVDTLKAQLEHKQQDCARLQHDNSNLKAQLDSEQRNHKESFQDLENEQSGYMTQIEQLANRSRQSELTNKKLVAELQQSKSSTQQLQQQNQQLASQFGDLKAGVQGRDQELSSLKTRFQEVVRDLTASESENAETRSSLKTECERSESLETELTDTWMKLREHGVQGVDVDIVDRLATKLDEARVRLEESERDVLNKEEKFEKQLNRVENQYQMENTAMQGKLQAALQETQELQKKLGEQSEHFERGDATIQQASRINELETSVGELRSQLQVEMSAKSEVQRKYDDLVAQSAHQFLERQGDLASTESDENTVQLETQLDEAGKEIEKLKKDSATEKEQKTLLEKAFQREQAFRKQLEERYIQSTQESGSSDIDIDHQKNSEIASIRADLKKAKKEREAVNLVRKQLVAAVDSLNSQLSEKDRTIEKVNAEVEIRGSQNNKLEEQLQESLSEMANLKSKVETLEAELKQIPDTATQLESQRAEQRQLKRQIGTLEEQYALEMHKKQSELETAEGRIDSLQQKVTGLETKLKAASDKVTLVENETAASILDMQKEEELLRSKCERNDKEIKRLRGELHRAQDNYDELELQFITKREDLKRFEKEHEEQLGQMGYRIQDLTSKLAATERKVRDLSGVEHRNRAKGALGAASGMGMQLTQTRQMENKLKELESKLGDVENTLQDQDQDTSSLLGKIVSVEQQVQARGQLPSTSSHSSLDVEHPNQPLMVQSLSRGSSATSGPCDSVSTSGADVSEDSESAPNAAEPDKTKQNFRARFLETKLSETELKLKEVTRKLVDVTTRELENRKAYQGKSVSEGRLKERIKVMEREVEAVTKELQQVQSNSRTFACAMRASLTDSGQLLGDIKSGLEWVDLELGADRDGLPDQQQRVEVATNQTPTSHINMLSCLKTLLTDACHKVDQCKQTALSQQTIIEKQSREAFNFLLMRERSGEGASAGSSFMSMTASSSESAEMCISESGSVKLSRHRNPGVIGTLERFAHMLSSEVILLGESTYVLHQTDQQSLAKAQMCLGECESLTSAMRELETALSSGQGDASQPSLIHTSQIISDLLSPKYLLQAEFFYNQTSPEFNTETTHSVFSKPIIDRHSKSRSPMKRQKRTATSSNQLMHSNSLNLPAAWTPKLDRFASTMANTVIKAGQLECLSLTKKDTNLAQPPKGNDVFLKLRSCELELEDARIPLQYQQNRFSETFDEHLKKLIYRLAEILAVENVRRIRFDKERNRKAGIFVDDGVKFESSSSILPLVEKELEITGILDKVGPDLVSYAKQIVLQEARGASEDLVEEEMMLVEVFHLLQVRVNDFLRKVFLEDSTCQAVLRGLVSVGKKRYTHIENFLEEELDRVKVELRRGYRDAVSEAKRGQSVLDGDGADLHVMMGDYVGLLGSLMIRKAAVGGLIRYIMELMPRSESQPSSDLDRNLDLMATCIESERVISRIPEPVSAEYENMAIHLANAAIEQAENIHLSKQLQNEWEQIMQRGHYSPIEHVTTEHARNVAELRRRYEDQLNSEQLAHEQELNALQEKYREAIHQLDKLEAKMTSFQVRRVSKPQITLTLEEDLNDMMDNMVATRLGEILVELDCTRNELTETQEQMAAKEKEYVKEVDSITDVMETMEQQYKTELRSLKASHEELVSRLRRDFRDHLEQLKKEPLQKFAQWKRHQNDETIHRQHIEIAPPDKQCQTRNNGDLLLQEKSHREIVEELRRSHNQEIRALEEEKEKELDEERKATSITVAALMKAHREELQAERDLYQQVSSWTKVGVMPLPTKKDKGSKLAKLPKRTTGISALHKTHKHELEQQRSDMQQNVSNDVEGVMKRHREVINKMDKDWKIISDKFTQVCGEKASLKKQLESLEKSLAESRKEAESWHSKVRELIGQKGQEMGAVREQLKQGLGNNDTDGKNGEDNQGNPLQLLLRFREAELQCTNDEIKQLTVALETAEQERSKFTDKIAFFEGEEQLKDEHIRRLHLDLEELQHQVEVVRTSGEGQAAQDQVQESTESGSQQVNPALAAPVPEKTDLKFRSWIPFLKRERSESTGKSSRKRAGSDAAKHKKGATTTE